MTARPARPPLRGLGRRGVAAVLLGALTTICGVGVLATSGYLLSAAALRPPVLELTVAIVGVRAFAISRATFRYVERLATHDVALRALARVRAWFVARLEPLAPGGLAIFREGDLLQRLAGDVDDLQDVLSRVVAPTVVALLTSLFALGLAGALAWSTVPAFGAGLLLAGAGASLVTWRGVRGLGRRRASLRGVLATQLVDLRALGPELVAFGREETVLTELRRTERALHDTERRTALLSGLGDGLTLAISVLTLALVAALAIASVRSGQLPGIALGALLLAVPAAFEAISPVPVAAERLDAVLASWRRVAAVARQAPRVVDPERPEPVPPGAPLRARGVSVRYGPEAPWALRDVDLELRPGRRVAIVGPSGAGKSTLAAALVRFFDVDEGRITLGDVDLRAMTQASLRATVCLVAQDAHVFAGSLRANLLLARPGATQAELDGAARRAELLSWIESLPEGWDTPAGELGARISGGQRRRLALARGYLAAAPILVLDEPGAHLDEPTADAITRHLLGAGGPRTLLLVTHRLPGLERADEVLVLEAGRITERGAPLDLLARPSRFRRLWELQAAAGSAAGATGGAR